MEDLDREHLNPLQVFETEIPDLVAKILPHDHVKDVKRGDVEQDYSTVAITHAVYHYVKHAH
tara:strand:+ start:1105 stop:1290 length:186 start_codon:yes stop_codon:yes gene_type:complete